LIFIRKINWANLGAFTTAGAFGNVNISGRFTDPGFEPSGLAFQIYKFTVSY
jgi:hypothetical protein